MPGMTRMLRHVLLCLLVAALPLQGWAVASMSVAGSCDAHASEPGASTMEMSMMDMPAQHHVQGLDEKQDLGSAQPHSLPHQGKACSACFAFSFPVSLTLTFAPLAPAPLPQFVATFTGHQPDGLERPPKSALV
jgi:hypothetical protein